MSFKTINEYGKIVLLKNTERFTGVYKEIDKKNNTYFESSYKNGLLEGITKKYNNHGELIQEISYSLGEKNGISKFFINGILVKEEFYEKNILKNIKFFNENDLKEYKKNFIKENKRNKNLNTGVDSNTPSNIKKKKNREALLIIFIILIITILGYYSLKKEKNNCRINTSDETIHINNLEIKEEVASLNMEIPDMNKNINSEIINNFKNEILSAEKNLKNADDEFLKIFQINTEINNTHLKRNEKLLELLEIYLNEGSDSKEILKDFNPELGKVYNEILSKFENNTKTKNIFRNAQRKWVTYKATLMEAVKDILPKKEGDLIIMYIDGERLEYLKIINEKINNQYDIIDLKNISYKKYNNKFHNFSINIPNSDFIIYEDLKEKISLYHNIDPTIIIEIFGKNDIYTSIENEYDYKINLYNSTLGYNLLKKDFYVVTYEKGNNVIYEKTMYNSTTNIYVTLLVEFPKIYKDDISHMLEKMVKSMKFENANKINNKNLNNNVDDLAILEEVYKEVITLDNKAYLDRFTKDELIMIRYTLYAKKGLIFDNEKITKYFESKPWYKKKKHSIIQDLNLDELIFDSLLGSYIWRKQY